MTIRTILIPAAVLLLLSSCGGGMEIDAQVSAKRAERDSLKSAREALNAAIADAEAWLAQHDPEQKRMLPTVTTFSLEPRDFAHWTEAHGSVRADRNALVYTTSGGEIRKIMVHQGQSVRKGQMIVDINTDVLRQNVQQAEANEELARTVYERQAKLWGQQIGSEVQFLEARTRKESAEAQVQALKDQLHSAQVLAPFDGVVDEIFPNLGDLASPMQPVARVVDLGKASIECDLAEDLLAKIKLGDPVVVLLPETGETINATIDQIGQYINPNNRTFKVNLRIDNGAKLRPNQLANVRIRDLDVTDALVIPGRVVMENGSGESYVYVLEEKDGIARSHKVFVKVLSAQGGELLIEKRSGGLKRADLLIDAGARMIVDKQEVQILKGA